MSRHSPCSHLTGKNQRSHSDLLGIYSGTDGYLSTRLYHGFLEDVYENGRKHWSLIATSASVFTDRLNCMEEQSVNRDMFRENQENELSSNAPVINVQVQNGRICLLKLFANHQYRAYLCCYWLLYPQVKRIIADKSRIRKAAERFKIIGTVGVNDEVMRILYGYRYRSLDKYAQETGL